MDILEPGSTFKTSIDISIDHIQHGHHAHHRTNNATKEIAILIPTITSEYEELKLPTTISIITLTETLLAHAPFITRSNRQFWRRWLLKKQFQQVLISGFYAIAECLSKDGGLDVARLYDINQSIFLRSMSNNFSQLFYIETPGGVADRDQLLMRLPEVLVFGIMNALANSYPKHQKVFNSVKFREIILDWTSELIGGIRPSFNRAKCEWLFQNVSETPLVITNQRPTAYIKGSEIPVFMQAACRGSYLLEHSPLLFLRLKDQQGMVQTTTLPSINNKNNRPESAPAGMASPNNLTNNFDGVLTGEFVGGDEGDFQYINTTENFNSSNNSGNNNTHNNNKNNDNKKTSQKKKESYSQFNPLALKCTLTHPPNRPLHNIIHPDVDISIGKIRCKKADFPLINRTLKECKIARKNILVTRENEEKKMRNDLHDMYETTQLQLQSIRTQYIQSNRKSRTQNKSLSFETTPNDESHGH